jgi:hypothetical protein
MTSTLTLPAARQPRGIPIGGEFTQHHRDEATVNLGPGGLTDADRKLRRDALKHGGFVPAIAAPSVPGDDSSRSDWWDTAFVRAEFTATDTGFHKMPDDFTPGRTGGQSVAGNRRTHRMRYEGAGVSLRMPSVTSLRAYAASIGNQTFDIPVAAEYPGGSVTGWARVTRNGPGEWSVSGLAFDPKANAYVSEAIGALLESRTPSVALRNVPDLQERRRARFAAGGVKLNPTEKSGFISGVGYNEASSTMSVKIGKKAYAYKVSAEVFKAVRAARSPGAAYNLLVKGNQRAEPIVSCPKCGRFNAAADIHRCPSAHQQPTSDLKAENTAYRAAARSARV